jgi:predicted  nucleic acid-binding Zn-ribbon protein
MINSLEKELDTIKRQIREQERLIRNAVTIEEKIAATKKLEQLESFKRRKRNELADREDEIASKRRKLLAELDSRMIKQTHHEDLFAIEWQIV